MITISTSVLGILIAVAAILNSRQIGNRQISSGEGMSLHRQLLEEVAARRAAEIELRAQHDLVQRRLGECNEREALNRREHEQAVFRLHSEIYDLQRKVGRLEEQH